MDIPTPKELLAQIQLIDTARYDYLVETASAALRKSWQGDHIGVQVSVPPDTSPRVVKRFIEDMRQKGWIVLDKSHQFDGRCFAITPFDLP